jgi:hypothetical protein
VTFPEVAVSLDADSAFPLSSLDDIGRALDELDATAPPLPEPEPEEELDADLVVEVLDETPRSATPGPIITGESPWMPATARPPGNGAALAALDRLEADEEAVPVSDRPLDSYSLAEILSGNAAPWVHARVRECAAALRPVTVAHWLCRGLSGLAAKEAPERVVDATVSLALMQLGEKLAHFAPAARIPLRLFGHRLAIEDHLRASAEVLTRRLQGAGNASQHESAHRLVALLGQLRAVFEVLQASSTSSQALAGLRDLLG